MNIYMKARLFFRNALNAILGIGFEILFVYLFIAAGLLAALLWWKVFNR